MKTLYSSVVGKFVLVFAVYKVNKLAFKSICQIQNSLTKCYILR